MDANATLQKALISIQKLKEALRERTSYAPIAIIGLGCRFPQANNKHEFWQLLLKGQNVISKIPEARWDLLQGTDETVLRDLHHPYWGGYLNHIDQFDPYFFGITPREALRMDPQQRLLLEVAFEALADAGLPAEKLMGSNAGVFFSLYASQFGYLQKLESEMDALYLPTGNATSIAANRLSYLLDCHGPSLIFDTACSSSLVALHFACLNLQNKSCDLAIVGGANINILPSINSVLANAKMLSPDGQCKTFDAKANGYVPGEGVGVIILKTLSRAVQDQDRIYAVIAGSGVNQDGKTNGLTAPNGLQQEALLQSVYKTAQIQPEHIGYIECHGTGTFLGDPIELEALGEIVGKNRKKDSPCWIGSVKTNLGHLEPAAGMASIIKLALGLRYGKIPPHLNFFEPNPHIAFDKYQFKVPVAIQEWPKYADHRLAGVSGFGFGGTNAHLVVREFIAEEKKDISSNKKFSNEVFTLSAKNATALQQLISLWCDYLETNPNLDLPQVCFNTHVKRSHYGHRLAIVVQSIQQLRELLNSLKIKLHTNDNTIFISDQEKKSQKTTIDKHQLANIDPKELAQAYVSQVNIQWDEYEKERHFPLLDMPLYPWQHQVFWPNLAKMPVVANHQDHYPLHGKQLFSPLEPLQFEFVFNLRDIPELQDTYHILHAGYYLEMLAFIVSQLSHQASFTMENHHFKSPMIASRDHPLFVQVILTKSGDEIFSYRFFSRHENTEKWLESASGQLLLIALNNSAHDPIVALKQRCSISESGEQFAKRIKQMGMPCENSIQWTNQLWRNENEILCEFQQATVFNKNENFILKIHPGIIDGCIQPLFRLLPEDIKKPYIASAAKRIKFFGMEDGRLYLYAVLKEIFPKSEKIRGDLYLLNEKDQLIAQFEDVIFTQLNDKIQTENILQQSKIGKFDLLVIPVAQRKEKVLHLLKEIVSSIFSMPIADIPIQKSLADMGLDSLMALVLTRAMDDFGVSYPMGKLLEGPSISDLADFIVTNLSPEDNPEPEQTWIAYRQKTSQSKLRLFCFPYGGSGASVYRDWSNEISPEIEICPIQLPGRENRLQEQPCTDINTLIAILKKELQPEFDLPFAFFGHSFGALIGFELARALRKENLPQPIHLFASAFPDPRQPTQSLDKLLLQLKRVPIELTDVEDAKKISNLTELQIKELAKIFQEHGVADYGEHLMKREIIQVLLPIFFGDMRLVKSYQFPNEGPLDIPITVFLGKKDPWVSYEEHLKWPDHTQKKCDIHEFDSGHLFIKDPHIRKNILYIISKNLTKNYVNPEFKSVTT